MAGARFKVENGILAVGVDSNSMFEHDVGINANLYVQGDLLYVGNNLIVSGNLVYSNTSIQGDLVPTSETGAALGNTTNRFDGYFRIINISGNVTPTANGVLLGNTTRRWDTYSTNVNASGNLTIGGNTTLSGNVSVAGQATFNNVVSFGNTTLVGTMNVTSTANVGGNLNVSGAATVTGNVTSSANVIGKGFISDHAAIFSNTRLVSNTSQVIIDSFPKSLAYFGKLIVTVNAGNSQVHAVEMLFAHENTNVLLTKYGEVFNTKLGTFDASINNANVEIYFTASVANTYTVKTLRQLILA